MNKYLIKEPSEMDITKLPEYTNSNIVLKTHTKWKWMDGKKVFNTSRMKKTGFYLILINNKKQNIYRKY